MDSMDIVTCEDNTLHVESAESQMKLTDLIDDCLIHIFSCLETNDLVNVAGVNSQFLHISRTVFSKEWVDILSAFEDGLKAKNAFAMTKNLLQRFGDLILSTGFDYSSVKNKKLRKIVHDLIMENCSNTLEGVNFLGINDSLKFTKPFPKVKTLFFHDGSFHHSMREIRRFFPNVERIGFNNVEGFSWNWGFQAQHIPSLQNFDNGYDCSHYAPKPNMGWNLDLIHLNHFIAANPQLRKFSTSLNSHECCRSWLTSLLEQNFVEIPENERKVNDHPMSFKITAKSCAADCDVVDLLIVPFDRVESLDLCLKGLTASGFITKCRNIKKLKLYLRFDSHLFNASYFYEIASALPMLEELFIALETKQRYDFFADFLDVPHNQRNEIKYEKGSICAIHPFIRQCKQLREIEFRYSLEYREINSSKKTEFSRNCTEDIRDFENIIRQEQLKWSSNNKKLENYRTIGYIYELTK